MSSMDGVSGVGSVGGLAAGAPFGATAPLSAVSMMAGKGGGGHNPLIPGYSNGQYTINGTPLQRANNYQIQGDNGTYNLLPLALNNWQGYKGMDANVMAANQAAMLDLMKGDQKAIDFYKNHFADPLTFVNQPTELQRKMSQVGLFGGTNPFPQTIAQKEATVSYPNTAMGVIQKNLQNSSLMKNLNYINSARMNAGMNGAFAANTPLAGGYQNAVLNKLANYATQHGIPTLLRK